MDIRISILEFLQIEKLTQVEDFSPSVDSGASVDHLIVLRLGLLLLNILRKFNTLSKTGFGIEIGEFCTEIYPIFYRKTSKITTFQKNRNIQSFDIFIFFS
jgi:hypothetical protein